MQFARAWQHGQHVNMTQTLRCTISISWSLLRSSLHLGHLGEDDANVQDTMTSVLTDDRCAGHSEYYVRNGLTGCSGIT